MRASSRALFLSFFLVVPIWACGGGSATSQATPTEDPPPVARTEAPAPTDSAMSAHFATALAADLTMPPARVLAFPDVDFLKMRAPDGLSLRHDPPFPPRRATGLAAGDWYDLVGATAPVAIYTHIPGFDRGERCPSVETILARLAGARVTVRRVLVNDPGDMHTRAPGYAGEALDVILFERDSLHGEGGAGFYVRREFDHGDHIADFCAAFGDRTDPFALRTTATIEEARRIAGALSTAHEAYSEGLES